jgi:hypothetical protein
LFLYDANVTLNQSYSLMKRVEQDYLDRHFFPIIQCSLNKTLVELQSNVYFRNSLCRDKIWNNCKP